MGLMGSCLLNCGILSKDHKTGDEPSYTGPRRLSLPSHGRLSLLGELYTAPREDGGVYGENVVIDISGGGVRGVSGFSWGV
jgi:hypothetical protein